jgi:hypothetical protein
MLVTGANIQQYKSANTSCLEPTRSEHPIPETAAPPKVSPSRCGELLDGEADVSAVVLVRLLCRETIFSISETESGEQKD